MSLHCWACNKPFTDTDELDAHLKTCGAAKAILLPVTALMFGAPDPRHFVAHLLWSIPGARDYIAEYANAVASDMNSWERAAIHQRLCKRLGVDYATFRPFESSDIREIPSKEECEQIIYKALEDLARAKLFGQKGKVE